MSSTPKVIAFIHWYYWSQSFGRSMIFYINYSGHLATVELNIMSASWTWHTIGGVIFMIIISLITVSTLVLFCVHKKHFYIQRVGVNPFNNIYRVLKYSWKQKVPECRNAFTYWEEDIPPHIDLDKTSMEDHSQLRRWRTPRHFYASYYFSCVCLDTI